MALTFEELKERIAASVDEVSILELLNINATDLCERFSDIIEERMEFLVKELDLEDSDDSQET